MRLAHAAEGSGVTSRDVLTRPARPPDYVLRYGPDPEHVADLRLPGAAGRATGSGPASWPLVIFLHGGFWRAAYDRAHAGPLAAALCAEGFAVCAAEYRRVGQRGGGWPGTFDDVAAAVGTLPGIAAAADRQIDARRLVLAGHSAGGHLALWAASRHRLPPGSPWQAPPSPARAVIGLAAVCELAACQRQDLGAGAAVALMGGSAAEHPDRYAAADPAGLLPVGIPLRLVHGSADDRVPVQMSLDYARQASATGDRAECDILSGAGHFEVIDPLSGAWPQVVAAFRAAA